MLSKMVLGQQAQQANARAALDNPRRWDDKIRRKTEPVRTEVNIMYSLTSVASGLCAPHRDYAGIPHQGLLLQSTSGPSGQRKDPWCLEGSHSLHLQKKGNMTGEGFIQRSTMMYEENPGVLDLTGGSAAPQRPGRCSGVALPLRGGMVHPMALKEFT
ncbi:uncharacterized protein [Ranitomeya imitator]|uniref:uncharacterized protein isoform X3 n=1 Tax=Ranitomeya imitator TaxID=111125 RepID=UPI0037E8F4D8